MIKKTYPANTPKNEKSPSKFKVARLQQKKKKHHYASRSIRVIEIFQTTSSKPPPHSFPKLLVSSVSSVAAIYLQVTIARVSISVVKKDCLKEISGRLLCSRRCLPSQGVLRAWVSNRESNPRASSSAVKRSTDSRLAQLNNSPPSKCISSRGG